MNRSFFSLRWKLAILFGCVFLMLHSVFSYLMYLEAKENFAAERKYVELSHVNIAKALTEDSATVLEQFAELLALIDDLSAREKSPRLRVMSALDENWSRWQLTWGMENVAFFDRQAVRVKSWGNGLISGDASVKQVLSREEPTHRVFCADTCYQQVIIPLLRKSEVTGAFSVIRSFADIIVKYRRATASDIGILIGHSPMEGNRSAEGRTYQLLGMTLPDKNKPVFDYIVNKNALGEFFGRSKQLELGGRFYEAKVFPVQPDSGSNGPFFLLVDDITQDLMQLNNELRRVWLYGVVSLAGSLIMLTVLLRVSLRRVEVLSEVLPLLSQNKYTQFRKQITTDKRDLILGHDELDKLSYTALSLTDQLERLEQEVRGNTVTLLEKSQDLAKERDFIRQLVDAAPIIIITQKLNGIILSINQAGLDGFEADSRSIIGKVFDTFVPDSDQEHLKKLTQLRMGDRAEQFQINGLLVAPSGKQRNISWLHSLLQSNASGGEPVVLSLGIDIGSHIHLADKDNTLSGYDYLTGLMNRQKFQEELAVELASAKRYGYRVALFYLDLDRFKALNAGKDHELGDSLLQQVANVLKDAMRSTDSLGRIGGDEFALIMPHAERKGIQQSAAKINQMLRQTEFNYGGKNYQISASIGIAVFPDHGLTVNELLANANFALCQVKIAGGAAYDIFAPDQDYQAKLARLRYWQEALESAIAKDRFVLLYQPVVDISDGGIHHYEGLLRLQKGDGSLILPAEFIGMAEQLDLIGKIDRWVLKKALQKLIDYQRHGKSCKLAINLSSSEFDDSVVFEDISRLLKASEIDPGTIIFEISETTAVSNFAAAETLISRLKELGCKVALDSFGVGFSSIYYLKHFPVDYIKIDGSFIAKIESNDNDKVFVKAVTGLAHAFNKKIVAEFVENEAILSILKEFGCDYAQGHYLGKPGTLD